MKESQAIAYMDTAERWAQESTAERAKVGAIVVKDDRIISIGYNGTPSGWDNCCEDRDYLPVDASGWIDFIEIEQEYPYIETKTRKGRVLDLDPEKMGLKFSEAIKHIKTKEGTVTYERRYRLITKPEVLHAETNAIAKLAKSTESANGATMFCTHSPCYNCAKLIYQSGISTVYYRNEWPASKTSPRGVPFLIKAGIDVKKC